MEQPYRIVWRHCILDRHTPELVLDGPLLPKNSFVFVSPGPKVELFQWKVGDTLPVSPVDGYIYSSTEVSAISEGIAEFTRKVAN